MASRRAEMLATAAVGLGAALLSAGAFVAFLAPGWPRTALGWTISAALGLPLLVLAEMILALCFATGPPRFHLVRRWTPSGAQVFRYRAGSRTAQVMLLLARIAAATVLFALGIWLAYLFLHISLIRAQFR